MPLDRTWFNTLVDDDGSGTGTIWNKTQIDSFMYVIDAAPRRTVWSPNVHLENGTQITVGGSACHFHVMGDAVVYSLYLVNISVPAGATGVLLVTMVPGYPPRVAEIEETVLRATNGSTFWGYARTRDSLWIEVRLEGNVAWAAGGSNIIGQGLYYFR